MGTEPAADTRVRGLDSGWPVRTCRSFGATSDDTTHAHGCRGRASFGTGSATDVVRFFREQHLQFPRRLQRGVRKGEIVWGELEHSRALQVLPNPRYSGTYVYGRHRVDKLGLKKAPVALPLKDWQVVIPEAHPGYINWDRFQQNLNRLRESSQAYGHDRRRSPPGQGPGLLQGLVICGLCGQRMTLRYHTRHEKQFPTDVCQREGIEQAQPICQSIPGQTIDEALGELLLELMTPLTLEVALAVQQELEQRFADVDRLRQQHWQRRQYEADLARRRFMEVDPQHRLVADVLEAEWNDKLRTLTAAQDEYTQQSQTDRQLLDQQSRQKVLQLATDFPALWRDPNTPDQQRKRMIRLLINDVTLVKGDDIVAQVCFKGGATRTLHLPAPLHAGEARKTDAAILQQIDALLNEHTNGEIARILNDQALTSGNKQPFSNRIVTRLCRDYHLKCRYQRLRDAGKLTPAEIAEHLQVCRQTVTIWCREGLLKSYPYNDKNECLFDPPDEHAPLKSQGQKLAERRRFPTVQSHCPSEV